MTLLLKFRRKPQRINIKKGLYTLYIALLFSVFVSSYTYAQKIVKSKLDTIVLSQYEYAILSTNNGSQCICYINNISKAQKATVVNTGDTQNIKFNDSTQFNGIHKLAIRQQLIAVADFKGSQLIVSNLSPYEIMVLVSILCPEDE
ncbi:hypothetical protein [Aquimarina sp. 2201CG5-10]|uniref:hypothetical protein n=1 Tax=Aquimarina callyspongiae TaxID=3098150 RepID=UPI002AB505BD|nr:hypothetical protein [Aquimarina sp. 2201CG5-10]MDY8137737.1 hypothetical protein [Aquimarina sp. 2201CG5-10]